MWPVHVRTAAIAAFCGVTMAIGSVAATGAQAPAQATPARDAAPQPARTGTASITGVVADGTSGKPIRRVTVTAVDQAAGVGRMSVTGDDGRFTFTNLPAGRFMVSAAKAAYLPTAYGVIKPIRAGGSPGGTAIALADGQQLMDVPLRMTRGGVVTGVVRGPDGRPMRGVQVSLGYLVRSAATGERTLSTLSPGSVMTDVRGEYRIFGVPPGEYLVIARPALFELGTDDLEATTEADLQRVADLAAGRIAPPTQPSSTPDPRRPTYGYAAVIYPGVITPSSATPIVIAPGEERGGVDFQIQLVPQSRLSGVVTGPDGRPAASAPIRLTTELSPLAAPMVTYRSITADAQGQFLLRGVPAGTYTVDIRPGGRGVPGPAATAWARMSVTVAPGADQNLAVMLQPGRTISGRVVLDPQYTGAAPDFTKVRVALITRDGNGMPATVAADGQFTIAGLTPDAYRFSVSVPTAPPAAPLSAKSGMLAERDAVDGYVNVTGDITDASIVLTDRMAEISGAILDAGGKPAPDYVVIVFPSDKSLWTWQSRRIQQARPSQDGKFSFRNLPAGDYQIGAVTEVEQYQWFDPAFLTELLGASVKTTLANGEKKVQEIRLR